MLHSITDVHAHYDEAVFDTDRGEVLRTLREAGVCAIVNSGSSVPSSRRSLDLAKRFEGVYASVGVFPLEAYNVPSGWLEQISDMAEEDRYAPSLTPQNFLQEYSVSIPFNGF